MEGAEERAAFFVAAAGESNDGIEMTARAPPAVRAPQATLVRTGASTTSTSTSASSTTTG
jgi:hypothetical protein